MAVLRATTYYLRNDTTVDTGTGIDIRWLADSNTLGNENTQSVSITHTQDNTQRAWDPATFNANTVVFPSDTTWKKGWALRPAEDVDTGITECVAFIPAGTVTVSLEVTCTSSGGTAPTGATYTPTFQAALFRYNPSTDTAVLLGAGTSNSVSWTKAAVGGDEGTFKTVTISIVLATDKTIPDGETLLLQIGESDTGTRPNPLSGTTTYVDFLRINNNISRVSFSSDGALHIVCSLPLDVTGKGVVSRGSLGVDMARGRIGMGTVTYTKATVAAKTFSLTGLGTVTVTRSIAISRSATGRGVVTMTRAVVAARSSTVTGIGSVSRQGLIIVAETRTVTGIGTVTSAKSTVASKSFTVIGNGVATESRTVQAQRNFNLTGVGIATQTHATQVSRTFNLVGQGTVTPAKAVVASRTNSLVGYGTIISSKVTLSSKSFDLIGKGIITEVHPVQAQRTFNLIGKGVVSGRIEIPIDEVPDGGGGGTTIIKRPMYLFDD